MFLSTIANKRIFMVEEMNWFSQNNLLAGFFAARLSSAWLEKSSAGLESRVRRYATKVGFVTRASA
jgi:hypothetical protein